MGSVYYDVRRRGGIARTYELLADGHTSHRLTAAVRGGEVIRVRQGHYACPEVADDQQRALRVGGRLSGMPGLRAHGVWGRPTARLLVSVPTDARALRTARFARVRLSAHPDPSVHVRWTDRGAPGTRSLVSVEECLRDVIRTEPAIVAFTAIESALHGGHISRATARALGLRRHTQSLSGRADSGGESMLKFRLLDARIRFRQQVKIDGVGRVDFLIGSRLVIEVDGAEFHTERKDFEEDRRRDAVLAALGYRVLRFSYSQVESRWGEVSAAIVAVMARSGHEW